MSETLVTLGGLLAISAIVWWFWLSTPRAVRAAPRQVVEIRVEGGTYQPAILKVGAGEPLTLRFVRIDASPCAEKVVFASLNLSADLPLGKPQEVVLPSLTTGTHEFTCQMGMYRGKLIVA
jgi:plastocyanin domain-containing protein